MALNTAPIQAQVLNLSLAVGSNDIYKTYDSIPIGKLKEMIRRRRITNKNIFLSTLNYYDRCALQIKDYVIKRTTGLPQVRKEHLNNLIFI